MNPEDVERLLGKLQGAPAPERLERKVLADGKESSRGRRDGLARGGSRAWPPQACSCPRSSGGSSCPTRATRTRPAVAA